VPATDPRTTGVIDLEDVPGHELDEIAHFFAIYKALEPGKDTQVEGWWGREAAEGIIDSARQRFMSRAGTSGTGGTGDTSGTTPQ
jgi:inorganic pyrophosphatase